MPDEALTLQIQVRSRPYLSSFFLSAPIPLASHHRSLTRSGISNPSSESLFALF